MRQPSWGAWAPLQYYLHLAFQSGPLRSSTVLVCASLRSSHLHAVPPRCAHLSTPPLTARPSPPRPAGRRRGRGRRGLRPPRGGSSLAARRSAHCSRWLIGGLAAAPAGQSWRRRSCPPAGCPSAARASPGSRGIQRDPEGSRGV
jgi:hypothetical protein